MRRRTSLVLLSAALFATGAEAHDTEKNVFTRIAEGMRGNCCEQSYNRDDWIRYQLLYGDSDFEDRKTRREVRELRDEAFMRDFP